MYKIILSLVFLPILANAIPSTNETGDHEIKKNFLSVVQDVHVENKLSQTSQFNKCRKDNEFKSDDNQQKKNDKLEKATKCFRDELAENEDPKALEKLSESLQLEDYGLVKSKNVAEITSFLTDKLIKSLTGVDPNEKNPKKILEDMRFDKRKQVDQKVFIEMYSTQLSKNALFEVSRFCFDQLRVVAASKETVFDKHWSGTKTDNDPVEGDITDDGNPSFFTLDMKVDTSDKKAVSEAMIKGIATSGSPISNTFYEQYWGFCMKALPLLCDKFKLDSKSKTDSSVNLANLDPIKNSGAKMSKGANACLTLDRLRGIRTALANTKKVSDQFDEMSGDKTKFALDMIYKPNFYGSGKDKDEESIDALTSASSADFLGDTEKNNLDKLAEDCGNDSSGSKCKDYLIEGDDLHKSIQTVETEMNFKREVEVSRIRLMRNKPDELKKYLTDNGMFDLLNDMEKNNWSEKEIETKIVEIYDARRIALVEGLKTKVGKRQVSEEDAKTLTPGNKKDAIKANITESRQEKARLAQVVMFNNIITSQLSLEDKAGNSMGRNVTGWKKEMSGLTKSAGYKENDDLFTGLQKNAIKNGNTKRSDSVVGGEMIDSILGKKKTP